MLQLPPSKSAVHAALAAVVALCVLPSARVSAGEVAKRSGASQEVPQAQAVQRERPFEEQRPRVEVAFVLDTTGSMGGLIEGAKRKIWSIANRIAQGQPTPHLQVALVAYRDVGDAYVTRRFDFTSDLDTVFTHLRGFEAGGGGDTPEHVGRALGEAVSKLGWSKDRRVMKLIFLVGDAPPAAREPEWDYERWARAADEHHIVVNTVRCGNHPATEVAWRKVATLTGGTFDTINASGGMVAVATPYDEELDRLNREIASRTRYAGTATARAENMARVQQLAALPAESKAERSSFMKRMLGRGPEAPAASSAPAPVAGAVDLTAEPGKAAGVAEEALPDDLRSLDKDAREKKVQQLAGERRELEKKVKDLTDKREAWRASNVAEKADAFDDNVMKSVRTQAKGYGLTY
ncbi:MAG: VWA domain-containing protein [Myxococcaceae bacterium]|nr:VWA domain-containing protein [Myxococcaceae bacterium]